MIVRPADAVRAALDMVRRIKDVGDAGNEELELKVGVHRGHSIAVTLNERLDYFGQNINIAARTQQLADAGEILLTRMYSTMKPLPICSQTLSSSLSQRR